MPGGSCAAYDIEPRVDAIVPEKPSTHLDTSPKSEPALEVHGRAALSVEAHLRVSGPNRGKNSGGIIPL